MKYIDAERLKAEIEKNTPDRLQLLVYRDIILSLIDYLQQEQHFDDLEEAAEKSSAQYYVDAGYSPFPNVETAAHKSGFIAGAEWQKEQMLKEAVEGFVATHLTSEGTKVTVNSGYLPKEMCIKPGDKVRIIVVKEDEK